MLRLWIDTNVARSVTDLRNLFRSADPKRALGWQEAIAWLTDLPG